MAGAQEDMVTGPDAMAVGLVMRMTVIMTVMVPMIVIMGMVMSVKAVVVGVTWGHGVSLRQLRQQGVKFKAENV